MFYYFDEFLTRYLKIKIYYYKLLNKYIIYLVIWLPIKWALIWYKYVITANLSGMVSISISDGSIRRGIPNFSPTSKAFLQFSRISCAFNVLNSLKYK